MSELAASYFDAERIAANPDHTYLSEAGAEKLLEWLDILEDNEYALEPPRELYGSAGFLIAQGHSEVDFMTTAIMLGYAAATMDALDATE